jgi:hypothetical protein
MAHQLRLYRARKRAGDSVAHRETIDHEPPRPSVPAEDDGGRPMVQVATEAPTGVVASPEAERVGGVSVQLDVGVERRRSFFWRLALRLVVRRLR